MALVIRNTEAFLDHPLQINAAPAHHTITLPIRPRLDQRLQFGLLGGVQTASRPCVLMAAQAIGSFRIEAMNPVPQCLAVHAAHARRIRSVRSVTDRCQG
ncbi:hypothetical protein A0U89_16675 (plasmid) [Kozakia baliensis]|uniref:Uncharacterized protein n=1 Tax=Kozakia baliensis TaxID=153496 RepID=A0A1D8UZ42_9PROT|nr:hypothetical protein A0U89_16675 [Kozakia baliensis]